MMPPSTREVMNSVGSKYAVVVGISKKARVMAENKELEEKEGHLADMVNHTLEDLIDKKLTIHHAGSIVKEEKLAADNETPEEGSIEGEGFSQETELEAVVETNSEEKTDEQE